MDVGVGRGIPQPGCRRRGIDFGAHVMGTTYAKKDLKPMIGERGAEIVIIAEIIFAGILGIVAGVATCLLLRRGWAAKAIALDAVLAMVVAIIVGYVLAQIAA